jgi:hypothetical protein
MGFHAADAGEVLRRGTADRLHRIVALAQASVTVSSPLRM